MEMVVMLITQLNGTKLQTNNATIGTVEPHVFTGLAPALTNASANPGPAMPMPPAIRSRNIAAKMWAKVVYEYLHRKINDNGVHK